MTENKKILFICLASQTCFSIKALEAVTRHPSFNLNGLFVQTSNKKVIGDKLEEKDQSKGKLTS